MLSVGFSPTIRSGMPLFSNSAITRYPHIRGLSAINLPIVSMRAIERSLTGHSSGSNPCQTTYCEGHSKFHLTRSL